jgi:hypothetical protein
MIAAYPIYVSRYDLRNGAQVRGMHSSSPVDTCLLSSSIEVPRRAHDGTAGRYRRELLQQLISDHIRSAEFRVRYIHSHLEYSIGSDLSWRRTTSI